MDKGSIKELFRESMKRMMIKNKEALEELASIDKGYDNTDAERKEVKLSGDNKWES